MLQPGLAVDNDVPVRSGEAIEISADQVVDEAVAPRPFRVSHRQQVEAPCLRRWRLRPPGPASRLCDIEGGRSGLSRMPLRRCASVLSTERPSAGPRQFDGSASTASTGVCARVEEPPHQQRRHGRLADAALADDRDKHQAPSRCCSLRATSSSVSSTRLASGTLSVPMPHDGVSSIWWKMRSRVDALGVELGRSIVDGSSSAGGVLPESGARGRHDAPAQDAAAVHEGRQLDRDRAGCRWKN